VGRRDSVIKWEYKAVEFYDKHRFLHIDTDNLNQLGGDGWELVTYSLKDDPSRSVAIFKRPKNQG